MHKSPKHPNINYLLQPLISATVLKQGCLVFFVKEYRNDLPYPDTQNPLLSQGISAYPPKT